MTERRQCEKLEIRHRPRYASNHRELEEAGNRFSPKYLDFTWLASKIVNKLISVVLRHQVCGHFITAALGKNTAGHKWKTDV